MYVIMITPELYGPMTIQPQNVNAMKRIATQTANLRKLGNANVSVINNTYRNTCIRTYNIIVYIRIKYVL